MVDWPLLASLAASISGTPCHVMSETVVSGSMAALRSLETSIPLRHWLSLKTQPLAQLVHVAVMQGFGVDVVSEYELIGALQSGVPASRILVNGVGKHRWLSRHSLPDLNVHFDSIGEVRALAVVARSLNWRIGLRVAVPKSGEWEQFGMTPEEICTAVAHLRAAGVAVRGLHFHLGTSIPLVSEYRHAMAWVADVAARAAMEPQYVDVGGGLPIAGEASLDGQSSAATLDLREYREWVASIPHSLPSVREVWLENGRFLSGPAGALVLTVLDRKLRDGRIFLICDGGRVNHARMASIERHEIVMSPERDGALRETVICGPTCGAVDRLGSWMLPESVCAGDRVIWLNAGAYHVPLETRFSQGLSPVVWFDEQQHPRVIRKGETPAEWWGHWLPPERRQLVAPCRPLVGEVS